MTESKIDLDTLERAVQSALQWHGHQRDKSGDPTIAHLFQVAGLAMKYRPNATTIAAAALLHDVLEDVPQVTKADLISRFGPEVAQIVEECSDSVGGPRDSTDWLRRKTEYLSHLPSKGDPARFVSLCDKVANARALELDLTVHRAPGEFFRGRGFNETDASRQLGYYSALADLFEKYPPSGAERLVKELRRAVSAIGMRLRVEPSWPGAGH